MGSTAVNCDCLLMLPVSEEMSVKGVISLPTFLPVKRLYTSVVFDFLSAAQYINHCLPSGCSPAQLFRGPCCATYFKPLKKREL